MDAVFFRSIYVGKSLLLCIARCRSIASVQSVEQVVAECFNKSLIIVYKGIYINGLLFRIEALPVMVV